jgi:hypothetical protein
MEMLICRGRNLLFQLGDFSLGFRIPRDKAFNNLPGSQGVRQVSPLFIGAGFPPVSFRQT